MLDDVTLCCSATISPAFAALVKRARGAARGCPAQHGGAPAGAVPQAPAVPAPPVTPPVAPHWERVALRRDGRRPVRAEALLVCVHDDRPVVLFAGEPVSIERRLAVHVTQGGDVLVHLRHQPPEGYPARPVYRVFQPRDAQDLLRSLCDNGPELCFDVSAQIALCQQLHAAAPVPIPVTT